MSSGRSVSFPDAVSAAVAGRGLAVFPLPAGSKAAGPGWQRRCTADIAVLARTWPDGANIGVGCRASGIVGLDLDRRGGGPDGIATFAALCVTKPVTKPRPRPSTGNAPSAAPRCRPPRPDAPHATAGLRAASGPIADGSDPRRSALDQGK